MQLIGSLLIILIVISLGYGYFSIVFISTQQGAKFYGVDTKEERRNHGCLIIEHVYYPDTDGTL